MNMKYIITESQYVNFLKRRLNPELYFDYIKKACEEYDMRGVDLDQFVQDIHTIAIDDFLIDEVGSDYLYSQEIYDASEGFLTDWLEGEIYDYVVNFYYDNDIDKDEDVSGLTFDSLLSN